MPRTSTVISSASSPRWTWPICTSCSRPTRSCCATLRDLWPSALLVLRAGRSLDALAEDIDAGLADIVPIARWALANPDVVERIRSGAPMNDADPATFYGGGAAGYTDYPALASISL